MAKVDSRYAPSTSTSRSVGSSSSQESSATSESSGSSSSFSGIANEEALASLLDFVKKSAGGGSESYKQQLANRQAEARKISQISEDYSTEKAFSDAAQLMAQQLRVSLEQNMPAISRAVHGSGTSASSMQGLLSQKLATETAQAAGALGAEQAKAYGNIRANLANTLEAISRINTDGEQNYLKALELLKVSTSQSQQSSSSRQQSNAQSVSGGGGFSGGSSNYNTYETEDGRSITEAGPFTSISPARDSYAYSPYNLSGGDDEYYWF